MSEAERAQAEHARPQGDRRISIAIDGPAGSGKSTLGAALAGRLGYTYFDSGVVYRAYTWLALARGVDVRDAAAVVRAIQASRLEVMRPTADDGRQFTVTVDGEDVTWEVRSPEVDHSVSTVAAWPEVRRVATEQLRAIGAAGGVVMVGRDIGTVVLPDAGLKLYLTASGEERARRRVAELRARGVEANYDRILAELRRRDAMDAGREAAPMRPAEDAILLDSDHLTVEEEVELVLVHLAHRA